MTILTRYILAQLNRYFLTLSIGFAALYLLIDFFEKFDEFTDAGKPMALVVKYFLLNIPFVVDQLSPILILLSGVITLGILNHNNELTALKAAGIPLSRIVKPILLGGLLLTTFFIIFAQVVLPGTISTTNEIWFKQVRGKVPLGIFRNGRYYYQGSEGFYSFQWPNKEVMVFKDFSYSTWDENYNVKSMTVANFADWLPETSAWQLTRGQIIEHNEQGSFVAKPFKIWKLQFPESPDDFLIPEYESAQMSLIGLFTDIGNKDTAADTIKARAEFYGRVSYLILGMPLLLLGLPILIISYRRWGRDLSIAIPISCFMAFGAWGIWGALQSFAKTGYVPPLPAAFSVHIVFTVLGLYLLNRQDR